MEKVKQQLEIIRMMGMKPNFSELGLTPEFREKIGKFHFFTRMKKIKW
ncbi:hypothetical protein X275_09070 [Marinitoga sp. 1197]|nr:hypothetical protein [Marinitoga sp. 1197]KLO21512.1 hypothetical protein X275_09070 [Marinitoga sp. 1197]